MEKDPKKNQLKILGLYSMFGIALMFAVSILVFWIKHEIANPIPMAIAIGVLIGLAFKLFNDAISREQDN